MPVEPPAFLTVYYVGVVPEKRGRSYVDDLLAAGTAILLAALAKGGSDKPLLADTDAADSPMAAAFDRTGWVRFARRREYAVGLAPTPGRSIGHDSQDREEDPKEDPEEEARMVERGGVVVSMHDVSEEE